MLVLVSEISDSSDSLVTRLFLYLLTLNGHSSSSSFSCSSSFFFFLLLFFFFFFFSRWSFSSSSRLCKPQQSVLSRIPISTWTAVQKLNDVVLTARCWSQSLSWRSGGCAGWISIWEAQNERDNTPLVKFLQHAEWIDNSLISNLMTTCAELVSYI